MRKNIVLFFVIILMILCNIYFYYYYKNNKFKEYYPYKKCRGFRDWKLKNQGTRVHEILHQAFGVFVSLVITIITNLLFFKN